MAKKDGTPQGSRAPSKKGITLPMIVGVWVIIMIGPYVVSTSSSEEAVPSRAVRKVKPGDQLFIDAATAYEAREYKKARGKLLGELLPNQPGLLRLT